MRRDAAARLERLGTALDRRRETVRVAGFELALECLDDLDDVIDQLLARAAPAKGEKSVAEVCPHFGVLWPAAVALSEHLVASGGVSGRSVLELGCGLAVPSIIAQKAGARRVVATDRHPLVPFFLARNAAANGVHGIACHDLDWRHPVPAQPALPFLEDMDLIIGSDLLYEPWQPGALASLLARIVPPDGDVVIADPGRRYVDRFVSQLEAEGFSCDLGAVRPVAHGGSKVDVLIIVASRV